jgi:hypothetical protein
MDSNFIGKLKQTCCGCFAILFVVITLVLVEGVFSIIGLVFACLSLREVTDKDAYVCLITVIVAYCCGILCTISLISPLGNRNASAAQGCLQCCSSFFSSLFSLYVFAIFIYAQVIYFNNDKDTYCSNGLCNYKYTVAMLGFIIANYVFIALTILILIGCCIACCCLVTEALSAKNNA